jgi:hypothetical protein
MRRLYVGVVALALAGCAGPSGEPAPGFVNHDVQRAYIPLEGTVYLIFEGDAAAVSIGEGMAVTNAHNANLLDPKMVIGKSADYDLLFFHADTATSKMKEAPPRVGQKVIAYGQGRGGELRKAEGVVTRLDAPVKALCVKCAEQTAFTFEGNAGPGFSGGPVVDAADGHLIGIVFGYLDEGGTKGARVMYAYTMRRVLAELNKVEGKMPVDVD